MCSDMDKRIVFEAANIICLVYTKPSMINHFDAFGVEKAIIDECSSFAKKRFAETVMNRLYMSTKESDQRIVHRIVEDLSCNPDTAKYNLGWDCDAYKNKLEKLRQLLIEDGYKNENGKLIKGTVYLPDIEQKYEAIIRNLKDYGRDDLAINFSDAIKNYSQGSPLSLPGIRSVIENLHKHILDKNGKIPSNAREDIKKLRDIGVLKTMDPKRPEIETDFAYNLYQMLSNWSVHGARTPSLEHEYLFQISILYLDFLIKRIKQSGVKTS